MEKAKRQGKVEVISGLVEKVIYHSDETGYTVCNLNVKSGNPITMVGNCATIWAGEAIEATGFWKKHPEHGIQFNAERIICHEPESVDGIRKYLASGMIKGIKDVLADRLVKKFGADTLRIIDQESAKLETVDGIGKKRREIIKASWNAQKAVRNIMLFLHSHCVSTAQANRIYKTYGDDAIAVVKSNPYRLATEVWGIGFKTADKIALQLGIEKNSLIRARAGINYILYTMTEDGHCFAPEDLLIDEASRTLEIDREILREATQLEIAEQRLCREDGAIYPALLFHAERSVAKKLLELKVSPSALSTPIKAPAAILWAEEKMKIHFSEDQKAALAMALENKISMITGGPGVGKTTIIKAVLEIFSAKHLKVQLAAPTGRAAKRMEEATGKAAQTLHRLLELKPSFEEPSSRSIHKLKGEVFIIDEVSMIDILLFNALLKALPAYAILILVGDPDQLPSIGPGNLLKDLIESETIPFTRLKTIFRQSEKSWIVHNAHRINEGQMPYLPSRTNESTDFFFIESNTPEDVIKNATELITKRIPQRFKFNPITDVQLLTPMRRFQLGTDNLNLLLQEKLNPDNPCLTRFGQTFRQGDKVMQLRNNYDKEIFNGDIGIVQSVNPEEETLVVNFENQFVEYDITELDELSLAYASTIHKSQGCEHPAVVILLATQHFKLLQRNLVYTAITRGKKLVCVIGSKKAMYIAVKNNQTLLRRTGLKRRLQELLGKWHGN
jgi:exodeoxyribonuclease V alpha subunit